MENVRLVVVGGDLEADEYRLDLPAILGRGRDVSLNLAHPLVSRRHCKLFPREGVLIVRDLDSLNGTFVGSDRIEESVVNSGDLLTVGTVTFRAIYQPLDAENDCHTAAPVERDNCPNNDPKTVYDRIDTRIDDSIDTVLAPHHDKRVPAVERAESD